ncbi:MAG: porin [Planctomycetota bacterium]|nr:porin [Planctomycetota bacterium]
MPKASLRTLSSYACWILMILASWSWTAPAHGQDEEDADEGPSWIFDVYRGEGLRLKILDGDVTFLLRGGIQLDSVWISEDSNIRNTVGDQKDGTKLRRGRLALSGKLYYYFNFKAEYDFALGNDGFKDVYVGISDLGTAARLRIGQFKEPIGLEALTSSNHVTFIERSLMSSFTPGRTTGAMIFGSAVHDRVSWALGGFRSVRSISPDDAERDLAATLRLTGLPWYRQDGRSLLHLGVAYSLRAAGDDMIAFRQYRDDVLEDDLVDTLTFEADRSQVFGTEAAWVWGPFSLQGEFALTAIESSPAEDPVFFGYYFFASLFLTGEHRVYDVPNGRFDLVRPRRNFLEEGGGFGAWEIGARYSRVELSDGPIQGGRLSEGSVGINWYLNPNARIMLDFSFLNKDGVGEVNTIKIRAQITF